MTKRIPKFDPFNDPVLGGLNTVRRKLGIKLKPDSTTETFIRGRKSAKDLEQSRMGRALKRMDELGDLGLRARPPPKQSMWTRFKNLSKRLHRPVTEKPKARAARIAKTPPLQQLREFERLGHKVADKDVAAERVLKKAAKRAKKLKKQKAPFQRTRDTMSARQGSEGSARFRDTPQTARGSKRARKVVSKGGDYIDVGSGRVSPSPATSTLGRAKSAVTEMKAQKLDARARALKSMNLVEVPKPPATVRSRLMSVGDPLMDIVRASGRLTRGQPGQAAKSVGRAIRKAVRIPLATTPHGDIMRAFGTQPDDRLISELASAGELKGTEAHVSLRQADISAAERFQPVRAADGGILRTKPAKLSQAASVGVGAGRIFRMLPIIAGADDLTVVSKDIEEKDWTGAALHSGDAVFATFTGGVAEGPALVMELESGERNRGIISAIAVNSGITEKTPTTSGIEDIATGLSMGDQVDEGQYVPKGLYYTGVGEETVEHTGGNVWFNDEGQWMKWEGNFEDPGLAFPNRMAEWEAL